MTEVRVSEDPEIYIMKSQETFCLQNRHLGIDKYSILCKYGWLESFLSFLKNER